MRTLTFQPGQRGESTFARPVSNYVETAVLLAGVGQTLLIPDGARFVLFSSTADFYATADGEPAVAIPIATTNDGISSELNPGHWSVVGRFAIEVIAPADCVVTMAFYA